MKEDKNELIYHIYRLKTIDKYNKKQKLLGYSDRSVSTFLYTRLLLSFLLFLIMFVLTDFNVLISLIITIVFYNLFSYFSYDYKIDKRAKSLEKDAIYFLEVLALSIESGKNLVDAIKVTVNNVDSELSKEFKKTLSELEYGKGFKDAFIDLKNRIPSDIIENVILNIVEVYTSGGDITMTLRKQIDFIQNKRVMDIKAYINQIPIKISIVSVFLFIPLVLLLVLAPVILEYFG